MVKPCKLICLCFFTYVIIMTGQDRTTREYSSPRPSQIEYVALVIIRTGIYQS